MDSSMPSAWAVGGHPLPRDKSLGFGSVLPLGEGEARSRK